MFAAGHQVRVAHGLDWNGSAYDPAQYLNYITKNFYCFTTPPVSYEIQDSSGPHRSRVATPRVADGDQR